MPGRPPLRLLLVAALLALTGCSSQDDGAAPGPVDVPVPTASSPAVVAACTRLLDALPREIRDGVPARPVTGDPRRTAAWGEPPVMLQCGAEVPTRQSEPFDVTGVSWNVRDIGAGQLFTTLNLSPAVSLQVPDSYESQAELLARIAKPLTSTLTLTVATPAPE